MFNPLTSKNMAVNLREKELVNGNVSLYLDIVQGGKRWSEFLNIHVNRKKPTPEDTAKRKLALEIKVRREQELIVKNHCLVDKIRRQSDFVDYMEGYFKERAHNAQRLGTLKQLRQFVANKPLPISHVTTEWMKAFEKSMLKTLKSNTVLTYLKNLNGALNELVRKRIIPSNPWHDVPLHDRLKVKEPMRTSWTIEQLQHLANTPCQIDEQFKQAFFFACSTGLRWSDVNKLQWTNIIRRKSGTKTKWFLYFEQQKTESVEYFPLSDQAIEIVKQREAASNHAIYVFPHAKETDSRNKVVQRRVDYSLKSWAKAAGLEHTKMRFHTGRHSFATNLLESGTDIFVVSKLLGHKNVKTTQVYTQVRDKLKEEAVRSLPKINIPF
jgi:integrase